MCRGYYPVMPSANMTWRLSIVSVRSVFQCRLTTFCVLYWPTPVFNSPQCVVWRVPASCRGYNTWVAIPHFEQPKLGQNKLGPNSGTESISRYHPVQQITSTICQSFVVHPSPPSIRLSLRPSVYPSIVHPVRLSVRPAHPSFCPSARLPICPVIQSG